MMKTVLKISTGLVGLFILVNGLLFMFKPELVMTHSSVSASNTFGMSTIRGLIGGSMLVTAILTLLGVIRAKYEWLVPASWLLLGWTVGRVVSLVVDGFDKSVLGGGVAISLVMALVLIAAHRILTRKEGQA